MSEIAKDLKWSHNLPEQVHSADASAQVPVMPWHRKEVVEYDCSFRNLEARAPRAAAVTTNRRCQSRRSNTAHSEAHSRATVIFHGVRRFNAGPLRLRCSAHCDASASLLEVRVASVSKAFFQPYGSQTGPR